MNSSLTQWVDLWTERDAAADSPIALVSSPLALRIENLNLARTSAFGQLTSSR